MRWLLLRGLAREARHWGDFPTTLSETLRHAGHNAEIETIDLPGTGDLDEHTAPLSIDATAAAARAHWIARTTVRKAEAAPTAPCYLLALSLGGMVANAWTTRWPNDFAGCVLISTSLRGYAPFYRRLRPSAYGRLVKVLSMRDALAREQSILSLVSNRPDIAAETAHSWADIARDRPIARATFARQLWAAATYWPRTPALPTLVLGSLGDRLVQPACSQTIATRWRCDFRQHPDAGHDLPLDDPAWVAAQICAWLDTRRHSQR
ncbi:MAG: alpha/beta fold hydrolase [Rhizobiales bacterium]|nr:alpha/beta fold hydrolase [Hyphomicrobiales bacterium]